MAKKRIKKILPRTNTGDIIEGFGPAGGVGGRTKVSNSITKKLGEDLTVNPRTVGPGKKIKARPNANFQQKLDEKHRYGTSIKNPDIPTSVSGKSNWKATDKIPTMFDISKTKPGSPQRAAVIKSANEAGVNKQSRVQIEGKYVNAPDVAQHKQIHTERLRYKSRMMKIKKSKPEYIAKKKAENQAAIDAAKSKTSSFKSPGPTPKATKSQYKAFEKDMKKMGSISRFSKQTKKLLKRKK